MRHAQDLGDPLQASAIPWASQMRATSREEPGWTVKTLTGAILACGGWVLRRSASDAGPIEILFEFERRCCPEIYSILVAAGLELSQSAHVRLTGSSLRTLASSSPTI